MSEIEIRSAAASLLNEWPIHRGIGYPDQAPREEREIEALQFVFQSMAMELMGRAPQHKALDTRADALVKYAQQHGVPAVLTLLSEVLEHDVDLGPVQPWTLDDERAASADLEHETLREA